MKRMSMMCAAAMLLVLSIAMSLVGCGKGSTSTPDHGNTSVSQDVGSASEIPVASSDAEQGSSADGSDETESTEDVLHEEANGDELTEQQRNSFSMLYHLAITAEEIRVSKENRLLLDDIYTSLLNDINPGAIDETTQEHLRNLRDIIKSYITISVKRDRLQYIYNQDKAVTIRNAVPDPLAVLSMNNAFHWESFAASVVYTAVDSYNNYKSSDEAIDQEYLMSGWELDDEETAAIQKNRERAFEYMVDIVQEYNLDGKQTLNEEAIAAFAEICAIESVQQKIRRLESEEKTYRLLGNYWLALAGCYFETAQYRDCLDCVERYNKLATGIYRKDYNYVQILPKAIVAAQKTYRGDTYISQVGQFADAILDNTNTEDWSVRYFAAQVYLDLYARTNDQDYLERAYNIAYDNVTILIDEQRQLNETYLADVQELKIEEPDYRFMTEKEKKAAEKEYKAEKKRLKDYNRSLEKTRETELAPLYEPLLLNCDLLFALAEEMRIDTRQQAQIEAILQTDTNGVFLVEPVNERYAFASSMSDYHADLSKNGIVIPAKLLTPDAVVTVTAADSGKAVTFDDCTVDKVEREGGDFDTFFVNLSSDRMKEHRWTADSTAEVEIAYGNDIEPVRFRFKVAEYKDRWLLPDKVVFAEA